MNDLVPLSQRERLEAEQCWVGGGRRIGSLGATLQERASQVYASAQAESPAPSLAPAPAQLVAPALAQVQLQPLAAPLPGLNDGDMRIQFGPSHPRDAQGETALTSLLLSSAVQSSALH